MTIPEGVTMIDANAFVTCSETLESVEIPEGVREIGINAFRDCRKLKRVKLPNSLRQIERSAFRGCMRLDEIRLPQNLETIGDAAFCGSGLTQVQMSSSLQKTGTMVFYHCYNQPFCERHQAGYIRKSLISEDSENGGNAEPPGENRASQEINGLTVWLAGEENAVSEAEWIDNGFDYIICLTDQTVTADVMTDYILATR